MLKRRVSRGSEVSSLECAAESLHQRKILKMLQNCAFKGSAVFLSATTFSQGTVLSPATSAVNPLSAAR